MTLIPPAPPSGPIQVGGLSQRHGQGPKYDEQGFGVTCGDELLVFSLDRFAREGSNNG